ncbi:MAG: hypothetical protein JSR27_04580 [Proteobacteria bacterium]|nr:hypothetical protein [Pseudomonadota bacterium]
MPLQLVLDDYERIDVPLDDAMLEAWKLQYDRSIAMCNSHALSARLASCVAACIAQCLDADLQLPTEKQIQFATAIARELNVSLPGDALRSRGAMHEFLNRFAEVFKARRIRRSQSADSGGVSESE